MAVAGGAGGETRRRALLAEGFVRRTSAHDKGGRLVGESSRQTHAPLSQPRLCRGTGLYAKPGGESRIFPARRDGLLHQLTDLSGEMSRIIYFSGRLDFPGIFRAKAIQKWKLPRPG